MAVKKSLSLVSSLLILVLLFVMSGECFAVTIGAKKDLVISHIEQNNMPAAVTAHNELIANYSTDAKITETVVTIADKYRESQKHTEALGLYKHVADNWPDDSYAMWAKMHIAISDIRNGNGLAAQADVDKLIIDFPQHIDISNAVCIIADEYLAKGDVTKSDRFYQRILDNWPGDGYAMWAKMHLVISDVRQGNSTSAQTGIDSLIMDYPIHGSISNAVCNIADEYRVKGDFSKANDLYQRMLNDLPGGSHSMWAKTHLVISDIDKGNYSIAETDIDKLIVDFASHEDMSNAICSIADEYQKNGEFAKADKYYQRMLDNWPYGSHSIWAKMHLTRSAIDKGNYSGAVTVLDRIQTDYSSGRDKAVAINYLAEGLYYQAFKMEEQGDDIQARKCLQDAINGWGRVPQIWPSIEFVADTYMMKAVCYHKLGEYDSAIEHFQIITTNYPDFGTVWHAQFMIGESKLRQIQQGQRTPEIKSEMIAAYQKVVDNYPGCAAEKAALGRIATYSTN